MKPDRMVLRFLAGALEPAGSAIGLEKRCSSSKALHAAQAPVQGSGPRCLGCSIKKRAYRLGCCEWRLKKMGDLSLNYYCTGVQ